MTRRAHRRDGMTLPREPRRSSMQDLWTERRGAAGHALDRIVQGRDAASVFNDPRIAVTSSSLLFR